MKRKVIVLGATGDLGLKAINIIKENEGFELVAFSYFSNKTLAKEISTIFPNAIAIDAKTKFKQKLASVLESSKYDIIIDTLAGFIHGGIFDLILNSKTKKLFLANKEELIINFDYLEKFKDKGIEVIPLDSEHYALYKLLKKFKAVKNNFLRHKLVHYYITASGGSLYGKDDILDSLYLEDILMHPTWKMSVNITIDSALYINKLFEVLEACYLFDIPFYLLSVILDRTSFVHAALEIDNKYTTVSFPPDMKDVIADAILGNGLAISYNELDSDEFHKYQRIHLGSENHFIILLFSLVATLYYNKRLTKSFIKKYHIIRDNFIKNNETVQTLKNNVEALICKYL